MTIAHDLTYPIQNVANSCKLMVKMWDDTEIRAGFERTTLSEFNRLRTFLDELRAAVKG